MAVYAAVYTMGIGRLIVRAVHAPISKDEAVVLCVALSGIAGVVLTTMFGVAEWWATRVPSEAACAVAALAALSTPRAQHPRVEAELQTPVA